MDSQWLKMQFELNPAKSKSDLARILGLEPPAVNKILNGSRQIKAQEYMQMRQYFDLPVDGESNTKNQARGYVVKPLSYKDIKRSALHDSAPNNHTSDNNWVIPTKVLEKRTDSPPEQIKIFEVHENTMEPDFSKGEHVLIDTSNQVPSPPGIFIVSDGHTYLLRYCEIIPNTKPEKIRLTANHKMFQPQTLEQGDFEIIGRVIAKLQWL